MYVFYGVSKQKVDGHKVDGQKFDKQNLDRQKFEKRPKDKIIYYLLQYENEYRMT